MKKLPLKFRLNVIGGGLIIFLAVRNYLPLIAANMGMDKIFPLWVMVCIVTLALSCVLPVIFIEKMGDFHPDIFVKKSFTMESLSILSACMLMFVLLGVAGSIALFPLEKMGIVFPAQKLETVENILVLILYFASLTIVPAFFEEMFVRATVLNFLTDYGTGYRVLTSAFLFTMMHTKVQSFLPVFGAGIILGCVYLYTGNIFMSVALHFLNNSYSFVMMYIQQGRGGVSATAQGVLIIAAILTGGLAGGMYLKSKGVDIFSPLADKGKKSRYTAIFKSPVMMLALLCCLLVIGSQFYVDVIM